MHGIAAIALWSAVVPAQGQELDAAWFKANYLPAAQALEKAYSECTAEVSENVANDKSDDFNEVTYYFACNGVRRKFERTIISHKGGTSYERGRTVVASPEVSFSIFTKQGKSPLLQRVTRSAMGLTEATRTIDDAALQAIYLPFALFEKTVAQQLVSKDFEIKGIKREGDRVRLDFRAKNGDVEAEGWIAFLPDLHWVIDRWDVALRAMKPKELSFRTTSELKYVEGGQVPALAEATTITYHSNRTETDRMVVDKLTFAALPNSEFRLSKYGFDDRIAMPGSVAKSLWFWFAIGGATCLGAALVLRQIMVKRATA